MTGIALPAAHFQLDVGVLTPLLNRWSRLEPQPYASDVQPALRAETADPLWFIGRQSQFLEYQGNDAGTPVDVRVGGETAPVSRVLAGPMGGDAAARAVDYDHASLPLEAGIEREEPRRANLRLAFEAGLQFERLLAARGRSVARIREAFRSRYAFDPVTVPDDGADRAGAAWRDLLGLSAIDGAKLYAALAPLRKADGSMRALPAGLGLSATATKTAKLAAQDWLAWYEAAVLGPAPAAAWRPERQEYALAVSARFGDDEVVLAADEYASGRLDWHAFHAVSGSLGAPARARAAIPFAHHATLASPVEYGGKPADRFWEFEDAQVNLGALGAGPTDLARLLFVEFALVYGNDWFIVPLELEVGSLTRITTFRVRDTFGVETVVGRSRNPDGRPWSMYELTVDEGAPRFARDLFFLPPTLPTVYEGKPIEEVALLRDEMANLAWGVERRVPGASGEGMDRGLEAARRLAQQAIPGAAADASLAYRLATEVPEQWIPLVPVHDPRTGTGALFGVQLERGAMLRTMPDGSRRLVQPRGVLLRSDPSVAPEDETPLRLEEEEVPREGAIVTRSFQFSRWLGGQSCLWLGRRKMVGRGEGASGLRFDLAERRAGPS